MIIKDQIENVIQGDSFGKVVESKINPAKLQKLFGILSGLYKNVYASIIREYCSNAWDSHKMAGKDDTPILVTLNNTEGSLSLSIADYGLGMSPKTMEEIYFNYLDSTKEDSDEVIGSFGVGSKSALAYTHTFYIDTIYDGILYHYMFSKQENGIPAGELLFDEKTDACNGTTINIPIKNQNDVQRFYNEMRSQLMYFPNVFVRLINSSYYMSNWVNDYKIYTFDNFVYRPNIHDTLHMHMCIGNVYYSISWQEIGRSPIAIPVALKFNIGELMPTPSREDIVYSKTSIEIINNKIDAVLKFLTDKYNNSVKDINSLKDYEIADDLTYHDYINIKLTENCSLPIEIRKNSQFISNLKNSKESQIDGISWQQLYCYKDIDWVVLPKKLNGNTGYLKDVNLRFNYNRHKELSNNSLYLTSMKTNYMIVENKLNHEKNQYLANEYGIDFHFIKKVKPSLNLYKQTILSGVKKENWRKVIQLFQKLSDEYIYEKYKVYDKIEIDKNWLDAVVKKRKEELNKKKELRDINKEIIYYSPVKGYNKTFIWEKQQEKVCDILKTGKIFLYTSVSDKKGGLEIFELLQNITNKKTIFQIIATSSTNQKLFKDMKNTIEYGEFLKSNHPILCKIATAYKIIENGWNIDKYMISDMMAHLSPNYYNKAKNLYKFISKYCVNYNYDTRKILDEVLKTVEKSGGLISGIINEAEQVNNFSEKFNSIMKFSHTNPYITIDMFSWKNICYIKQLMKYEKLEYNKKLDVKLEFNEIYKLIKNNI